MAEEWFAVSVDLVGHRKVRKLAHLLGIDRFQAVGLLVATWAWAFRHEPNGDLSEVTADDLAEGIGWRDGNAMLLLEALVASGWVNTDGPTGARRLHEWEMWGGRLHEQRGKDRGRKTEGPRNAAGSSAETDRNAAGSSAARPRADRRKTAGTETGIPEEFQSLDLYIDLEKEEEVRVDSAQARADGDDDGEDGRVLDFGRAAIVVEAVRPSAESPPERHERHERLEPRRRECFADLMQSLGGRQRAWEGDTPDAMAQLCEEHEPEVLRAVRDDCRRECRANGMWPWPGHLREHIAKREEAARVAAWGDHPPPPAVLHGPTEAELLAWEAVRARLRSEMSPTAWQLYIADMAMLGWDEAGRLLVSASSEFSAAQVNRGFATILQRAVGEAFAGEYEVVAVADAAHRERDESVFA